jgi:hypothetical protein
MDERVDVMNVVASLSPIVDGLRWNDLRAILTPEVMVDYTSIFGGSAQKVAKEDLIARWRELLPGFTRTTHLIGAIRVSLVEGFGYAEAPVMARHMIEDDTLSGGRALLVGGRYEIQTEKHSSGEWCIRALTLADGWAEGNRDLLQTARERVQMGRGRKCGP